MLSLGARIRELRVRRNMTQIDLSKNLCTPSMISQIESDRARPSYKILFEIAQKLDITLDKLLVDVHLDLEYLSLFKLAQAMVAAKEYRAALPLLLTVLEEAHTSVPQAELMYAIGVCRLHVGDLQEAEQLLEQVQHLEPTAETFHVPAATQLMLGLIEYRRRNLPVALHVWTHALDELRKSEPVDPTLELELLLNIASAQFDSGKMKDAVAIYEEILATYGGQSHLHQLADIHKKLGESFRRLGQHGKAIHHLEQAQSLFRTVDFQHALLEVRRQHAILQGEKGNLQQAVAVLEEVVEEFERVGDAIAEGTTLVALGKLALEQEQHDQALLYAERASKLLPSGHAENGDLHRLFSTLHFAADDTEAGIAALRKAIQSFREHNRLLDLEQATQELCERLARHQSFEVAFKELLGTHSLILESLTTRGIVL